MKKFTFFAIAFTIMLFLNPGHSKAQKYSFGVHMGGLVPMGAFGATPTITIDPLGNITSLISTATGGFSLGIHGRYFINDNIAAGLNIGYSFLGAQQFAGANAAGTISVMPIMAAIDYYFSTEKFKPFAGLELGFIHTKASIPAGFLTYTGTGNGFAFAPVVGVQYDLTDNIGVLFNAKYMVGMNEHKWDGNTNGTDVGVAPTSYIGYNLGVNFIFDN